MSIQLPNLDDRRFEDLVEEGRRLIPGLAPSWTDHNASDPGITLLEMFASLGEMLMYRANRVNEECRRAFVQLLRGPDHVQSLPVDEEIRLAVLALSREERAITNGDFERLALAVKGVARAHCVARRDLEARSPYVDAPAHISVVVVPADADSGFPPTASTALLQEVMRELTPRCLLTTRLHVVSAGYLPLRVAVEAHVFADQDEQAMQRRIGARLAEYFSPQANWPFDRAVYLSDLYTLLDGVEGLDYATPIGTQPVLATALARREIAEGGRTVGLRLEADELVWLESTDIRVIRHVVTVPEA